MTRLGLLGPFFYYLDFFPVAGLNDVIDTAFAVIHPAAALDTASKLPSFPHSHIEPMVFHLDFFIKLLLVIIDATNDRDG